MNGGDLQIAEDRWNRLKPVVLCLIEAQARRARPDVPGTIHENRPYWNFGQVLMGGSALLPVTNSTVIVANPQAFLVIFTDRLHDQTAGLLQHSKNLAFDPV